MKRFDLIAVLIGLMAVVAFTNRASAMYDPGMGRFLQRDPGAGGPMRAGSAGISAGGQFMQRDPYADGMNLYQYVRSRPTIYRDPTGLACSCGPDITPALVAHLSDYLTGHGGKDSTLLDLVTAARSNGWAGAFGTALSAYKGDCGAGECQGTVTFCGHCISQYHIDHLLIMVYIAKHYGLEASHLAGLWNERGGIDSPSPAAREVSRADLAMNQAGQALFPALVPFAGKAGTQEDACASVEGIMGRYGLWAKAQKKPAGGGTASYGDCKPCKDVLPVPPSISVPR